jgi:hypothetical protein
MNALLLYLCVGMFLTLMLIAIQVSEVLHEPVFDILWRMAYLILLWPLIILSCLAAIAFEFLFRSRKG